MGPTSTHVRVSADPRFLSHIEYLQSASGLVLGGRPPSVSQTVRRAVGLLVDHFENMADAARIDGRRTLHEQDATAERASMLDYSHIRDAARPRSMVSGRGRLNDWEDAVKLRVDNGLSIPTAAKGVK